jgi:glycosyltransferase involved in cell wall biosynthesis
MTLPTITPLEVLMAVLPRYAGLWLKWADRWPWMDAAGEAERLNQHARAKRYGGRAAKKHRNAASARDEMLDVEVLITLFRYKDYVAQAVASAEQAIEALKERGLKGGVVVVEDCGNDGSWELCLDLADRSSVPIRMLQPAKNVGLTGARNLGMASSKSRALFVLDADNRVHPHALVALYELLRREHAVAAYGPLDVVTLDGEHVGQISDSPPDRARMMTEGNYIDAMALFDTDQLKATGGWDPELLRHCWGLEDYELWVRLMRSNRPLAFLPDTVGTYLLKENSMARHLNPRTWSRFCAYMRRKHGPEFQVT